MIVRGSSLHFDVSTGLKSVLGSELITNDEVAIFELVKNSFDARAKRVDIYFGADTIVVSDDGEGMSKKDIQEKWLFVAYSSKRLRGSDFRHEISERSHFAGSKGIGRFSSDRLGKVLTLQTRPKKEKNSPVHSLVIDWDRFDEDHLEHFESVGVKYRPQPLGFELPKGLPKLTHGTAISIEGTRRKWDRDAILDLKSALAKLINPFGASTDGFRIRIHAPAEQSADDAERALAARKREEPPQNALANGEVGNFIFSTLREKTTFIEVNISEDGRHINSALTDRGELIYRIREPNVYPLLASSGFQCQIYFLNLSAKMTFARRMGVPSVQFGSVFLFRNGFRVFPIGNEGDDWFGIDRRKQQGYARFLGTRDVIGRVDVAGGERDFQEASSRNAGLIESPSVAQLRKCCQEHCLRRLERYVVPVTFIDKEDKNTSDLSRLRTDPGRARVAAAVAKLVDNNEIELLEYNKQLIGILDEQSSQFEASLSSLRAIADKTKDRKLFNSIEIAERKFEELRKAEEVARRQADEERAAKEEAQQRAAAAEQAAAHMSTKYDEEQKRNLFLTSIASLDTETILNLHHQVTIYSVDIQQQIENLLVKIASKPMVPTVDVVNAIERIALLNRKIMGISKFATKANFRLQSEKIEADLGKYVQEYIDGVARDFLYGGVSVAVANDGRGFVQRFKPIDVSVIVDNMIANARKARARTIQFEISHPTKDTVHIKISDDGRGFSPKLDALDRIFEKGFTLTDGSGLGLYHVKQVLGEMQGTIEAKRGDDGKGAAFLIRISK